MTTLMTYQFTSDERLELRTALLQYILKLRGALAVSDRLTPSSAQYTDEVRQALAAAMSARVKLGSL